MSVNYHCTVCGAQGNSDDPKSPCIHGFRFQQIGFRGKKRRLQVVENNEGGFAPRHLPESKKRGR